MELLCHDSAVLTALTNSKLSVKKTEKFLKISAATVEMSCCSYWILKKLQPVDWQFAPCGLRGVMCP